MISKIYFVVFLFNIIFPADVFGKNFLVETSDDRNQSESLKGRHTCFSFTQNLKMKARNPGGSS